MNPLTQAIWESCLYDLCIAQERLKNLVLQIRSIEA
jgi:hypothetical protein